MRLVKGGCSWAGLAAAEGKNILRSSPDMLNIPNEKKKEHCFSEAFTD